MAEHLESLEPTQPELHAAQLEEYRQVAAQFRTLTEIRFKLLAFLPVGTIATALASKGSDLLVQQPTVAIFGLLITLALATYNKRNDQLYDELVSRAAQIERKLGLTYGSFSQRPTSWLKFGPWKVNHRWSVGLVYAASFAIWLHLLVYDLATSWKVDHRQIVSWLSVFITGVGWALLVASEKLHRKQLREEIDSLRAALGTASLDELVKRLTKSKRLSGLFRAEAEKTIRRRLKYQWAILEEARRRQDADAQLEVQALALAATVDLPARWIYDVWSGRR